LHCLVRNHGPALEPKAFSTDIAGTEIVKRRPLLEVLIANRFATLIWCRIVLSMSVVAY
jgi:hypothetical protein